MNRYLVLAPASLAGMVATLFIAKADAADYMAGFSIEAETSRNDNIRSVQTDKTAATKYGLSPRLTAGVHTETTQADLNSTFDLNRYDKSEFNSNDANMTLALNRQFERSSLGLNANYVRNSTLTSELLTSGRIGVKADRSEQYSLAPNWSYTFTEANLIQLQSTYTEQNYGSLAYIGYKSTNGELDWIHLFNDRARFTTAATYSDYQSDAVTLQVPEGTVTDFTFFPFFLPTYNAGQFGEQSYRVRTKSMGAQVGVDYQWSEQSQIKVRIGRSQNRTSYPVKDSAQICSNQAYLRLVANRGPVGGICTPLPDTSSAQSNADVNWIWSSERQQFSFNVSKAIQPTSNGYAVDATQLASNWNYQLSALNSITASLSVARNRAIDNTNTLQNAPLADRNYGSATLQYQRQLNEHWFLNASFQFSEQQYIQIDYQASSKVYSLHLSYRPQQWHWAR
jgi:hypothetical protein